MGFDTSRFVSDIPEELLCSICNDVLEVPVQVGTCQHYFCKECITTWLNEEPVCPIDRSATSTLNLTEPPRLLLSWLGYLRIRCDHVDSGCKQFFPLESLPGHLAECKFDPKRPVKCDRGCELYIMQCDSEGHNCLGELKLRLSREKMNLRLLKCIMNWKDLVRKTEKEKLQDEINLLHSTLQKKIGEISAIKQQLKQGKLRSFHHR